MTPSASGDVGERVAGADHLHRQSRRPGCEHRVDHLGYVVRGQHVLRMGRAQPATSWSRCSWTEIRQPRARRWTRVGRRRPAVRTAPRRRRSAPPRRTPVRCRGRRSGSRPATRPARCRRRARSGGAHRLVEPGAGRDSSISENRAMIVGRDREARRRTAATRHRPEVRQERGRRHRHGERQQRRGRTGAIVVTLPRDRAREHPRQQAAQRQTAEHQTGDRLVPVRRPRTRPWPPRVAPNRLPQRRCGERQRDAAAAHGIGARSAGSWSRGCAGGSVPRWAARPRVPTVPTTTAAASPATGARRRGQERDQGRTGHEDDLVGDALDREGGVPLARVGQQVRPAGADASSPIWGHRRPGDDSRQERPRHRPVLDDGEPIITLPRREDHRVDEQHAALAEPVGQPAVRDRDRPRCR